MDIDKLLGGFAEAVDAEAKKVLKGIMEKPLYVPSLFPDAQKSEYNEFYKQVIRKVRNNPEVVSHREFIFAFPTADKYPYLRAYQNMFGHVVNECQYDSFKNVLRDKTATRFTVIVGEATPSAERVGMYSDGYIYKVILYPPLSTQDHVIYVPVPQAKPVFPPSDVGENKPLPRVQMAEE